MSVISEFATYFYASRIGIRLPLENIPYLKATIFTGSLILPILVGIVFLTTRLTINLIYSHSKYLFNNNPIERLILKQKIVPAPKIDVEKDLDKYRSLKTNEAIKRVLLSSILTGILAFIIDVFYPNNFGISSIFFSLIIASSIFITYLILWKKSIIWIVALLTAISFYVLSICLIFNIEYYSIFLRYIGYGGGLKIEIEYESPKNEIVSNNYYLLLRTSESLITLDMKKKNIFEIPVNNISKIKYDISEIQKPLDMLKFSKNN